MSLELEEKRTKWGNRPLLLYSALPWRLQLYPRNAARQRRHYTTSRKVLQGTMVMVPPMLLLLHGVPD